MPNTVPSSWKTRCICGPDFVQYGSQLSQNSPAWRLNLQVRAACALHEGSHHQASAARGLQTHSCAGLESRCGVPELPAQSAELPLGDLRALDITHVLGIPPPAIILLLSLLLLVFLTTAVAILQFGDTRVRAFTNEIL